MMEYKGYVGNVELDHEAGVLHGEVVNTRDVITFQADSVSELTTAFHESIDDYLAFCAARGEAPEKPSSGKFVVRLSPELHRQVTLAAVRSGKSLNSWVVEQLAVAASAAQSTPGTIAKASKPRRRTKKTAETAPQTATPE